MKQISNNPATDRYLVLIDCRPDLESVTGMQPLRLRTGRTVQAVAMPNLIRVANFLNIMDKQLRRMRRVEADGIRVFQWSFTVVDRLVGAVLTVGSVSQMIEDGRVARTYTRNNTTALPVDDTSSRVVNMTIPSYRAFLSALRIQTALAPMFLAGEDPIETLQINHIRVIEDRDNKVLPVVTSDQYNIVKPSNFLYYDSYTIPTNYPDRLMKRLDELYPQVSNTVLKLRTDLLEKNDKLLEQNPSQDNIRASQRFALRLDNFLTMKNDSMRGVLFHAILNSKTDFTLDTQLYNYVQELIMPFIDTPWTIERASYLWPQGQDSPLKPLYINRPLLNGIDVHRWASSQGFKSTLNPDEMHVTLLYSKTPVDWAAFQLLDNQVSINDGVRTLEQFGKDKNVTVMQFESSLFQERAAQFVEWGGTSDFVGYKSHITLSYEASDMDLSRVVPYMGPLIFGAEVGKEIVEDWIEKEKRPELKAGG